MNLIEHLWIRWPSVELSQIINWIGLTSLINWVKIPQFCQPYLLMLIGNRLVKLNGPAASGRNHIFKICMLSLFSMSYPLAIKNGNGHSPVIIHLHLNSPVFSASPGFPAIFIPIVYAYCLVYTTTSKFMIIIIIYIYIYIYIFVYFISYTVLLLYIYIYICTYNVAYVMYIYRYMEHGRSSIVSAISEVSQSATVFPQNTCGCSA